MSEQVKTITTQNLAEALERQFNRRRSALQRQVTASESPERNSARRQTYPRSPNDTVAKESSRQRRLQRYQTIKQLRRQGVSISGIAKLIRLHRETVRTYYYVDTFPERAAKAYVPSILDPYIRYLRTRFDEGCDNAMQLWREIAAKGYPGQYCQVVKWVRQHRTRSAASIAKTHLHKTPNPDEHRLCSTLPSSRNLAWLVLRREENLTPSEKEDLLCISQDPIASTCIHLAQQFRRIIDERLVHELDDWLVRCIQSRASAMQNYAKGIQRDITTVRAALEWPWSNAQSEGQINRLKLIKRQMYGRASFDLLRRRVLYKPP